MMVVVVIFFVFVKIFYDRVCNERVCVFVVVFGVGFIGFMVVFLVFKIRWVLKLIIYEMIDKIVNLKKDY